MKRIIWTVSLIFLVSIATAQNTSVRIGLLKYKGGGDWYANPTSLPNLIKFCNEHLNTNIHPEPQTVEPASSDIFSCALIHMTGHGNVVFSNYEAENLRNYMLGGGFLHIDDNYGMDEFVRREIKKIFPDKELIELPFSHPIYHSHYEFPNGLPKVHEHDNLPPQGFGIIHEGRLVLFYSYETDLGNGWEDASVHGDSEEIRTKALQMGANIIRFAFSQ
ncbi:MAG: DUF4159 domain-containing protein [Bacteroidales bacterium]|nr:DUF4159 domain-containing protein [Bacteroidales bacterium]